MNGLCSLLIRAVLTLVVLAACVAPAVAQEVVEYIHTDALGSPVAITDASGNVIERTVYEPYFGRRPTCSDCDQFGSRG